MRPVWAGGEVYRETFAMVKEGGICAAPFLYEPEEILRVESYDGERIFEPERDWHVEKGQLVLTEDSRIPCAVPETFYHTTEKAAMEELERLDLNFGPVRTRSGRYIRLDIIGHPERLTRFQVAVTYRTGEAWSGEKPVSGLPELPRFAQKTGKREKVRIVLFGDSISCGYDCSGMYGLAPHQPIWPLLLQSSLEAYYQSEIELINTSLGGMDSDWALGQVRERVCIYQPDLVLLGFGMNDRCPGKEYAEKTEKIIRAIRSVLPGTEFVLMATSLPNPLAATAPLHFWAFQDEYAHALQSLCGPGIVMADIQGVQKSLLKKKRYIDMTGNLLNHPNDYLARIQAQVSDTVLKPQAG